MFDSTGEGSCSASVEEVQTFFVGLNFDVMLPITAFTVLAESFSTNIEGLIEWEVGFSTCSAFKSAYHPSLSDYPHILAAYMQHFSEFFRDAHMLKDNTDLSIQVCAHLGAFGMSVLYVFMLGFAHNSGQWRRSWLRVRHSSTIWPLKQLVTSCSCSWVVPKQLPLHQHQ